MVVQRMINEIPVGVPGATQPAYSSYDTTVWNDRVHGSIDTIREEIRDSSRHGTIFKDLNPDEAIRLAGGYSARMSFLAVLIKEIEDDVPGWRAVRLAAEGVQEEMRWQHGVHSRLHQARIDDWKVETGER